MRVYQLTIKFESCTRSAHNCRTWRTIKFFRNNKNDDPPVPALEVPPNPKLTDAAGAGSRDGADVVLVLAPKVNPEAEAVERKETNCERLNQSEVAKLKYKTTKWQAVIQYAGIKRLTEQRSIK